MTISTVRTELRNFPSQSRMPIDGWAAILFSLPFTAAGVVVILASYNIIPTSDSQFNAPRHLVALCGALFFVAGELVFFQGISGLIQQARVRRYLSEHPGDVTGSDYPWDRRGIKGDGLKQVMTNFAGWSFFAFFLSPFNWLCFFANQKKVPKVFHFMTGLFDIIVICGITYCFYLLIRFLRYGQSFFRFSRFPFQPGGTVEGTVMMTKPLKGVSKMKTTLRFVEEKFETRGTGDNRSTQTVCYELYSETVERTDFPQYGPDIESVPVSFVLPQDLTFKNNLSSRPPRYWQLEVSAATPGVDYFSRFLVPVY